MKFFYADSLDTVDPGFDFAKDKFSHNRNRQTHDVFAHELITPPPYHGILISYALISGKTGNTRYSPGQRHRLLREGARNFFRFPYIEYNGSPFEYPIMGDCGAFSCINETVPPYTPEEILQFYIDSKVTHGVSPDHLILEKNPSWDKRAFAPRYILDRAELTSTYAKRFIELHRLKNLSFIPIGVIQSWSPQSAVHYAAKLIDYGYEYLGLGGMASRPTDEIFDTVATIRNNIPSRIKIHIFGFNRIDQISRFSRLDVTSFDSTSPLLKSFKDDLHNYFSPDGNHYIAFKVLSLHESKLKVAIQNGQLNVDEVSFREKQCIKKLIEYDKGIASINETLDALLEYEQLHSPTKDNRNHYLRTLSDKPWQKCPCEICSKLSIQIMLYRGLNRNKRRGYHNMQVVKKIVDEQSTASYISAPCIKFNQSGRRPIYSFVMRGKDIPMIASVSRINRTSDGILSGYQRPEIADHITEIQQYIEQDNSILPNSIVIAFSGGIKYIVTSEVENEISFGLLQVDTRNNGVPPGLIVDGQQRVAALKQTHGKDLYVNIVAFESTSEEEERRQFVLVNNTRPLPKSLIYEL